MLNNTAPKCIKQNLIEPRRNRQVHNHSAGF